MSLNMQQLSVVLENLTAYPLRLLKLDSPVLFLIATFF